MPQADRGYERVPNQGCDSRGRMPIHSWFAEASGRLHDRDAANTGFTCRLRAVGYCPDAPRCRPVTACSSTWMPLPSWQRDDQRFLRCLHSLCSKGNEPSTQRTSGSQSCPGRTNRSQPPAPPHGSAAAVLRLIDRWLAAESSRPEARAQCGSSARWDLCRGGHSQERSLPRPSMPRGVAFLSADPGLTPAPGCSEPLNVPVSVA
jgi:hypothetical protein